MPFRRRYLRPKGWRGDSYRHSLAAKGIKSGRKKYHSSKKRRKGIFTSVPSFSVSRIPMAQMRRAHLKTLSFANDSLPIMKSLTQQSHPEFAIPIEILYRIYKNRDAIYEVGQLLKEKKLDEAGELAGRKLIIEGIYQGAKIGENFALDKAIDLSTDIICKGTNISEEAKSSFKSTLSHSIKIKIHERTFDVLKKIDEGVE